MMPLHSGLPRFQAVPPRFAAALFVVALGIKPLGCPAPQRPPGQAAACIVSRVVDGDTFYCRDGRKVRLIGVDSPERQQGPFGGEARRALLQLLPPGTAVVLQPDVTPTDRYGRVLAYVWTGPMLVNETMVQKGWAVLYTVPPNVKYAERLERAQKEARARSTGLWAQRGFDCLPSDFRKKRCLSPP
jgi:micrococcal nuclease